MARLREHKACIYCGRATILANRTGYLVPEELADGTWGFACRSVTQCEARIERQNRYRKYTSR